MVDLSGALVMGPMASLIKPRSMLAAFVLLATSIVLLVVSATVGR